MRACRLCGGSGPGRGRYRCDSRPASLSFGVNWIYNQLNYGNVFLANGNWTFNGQASGDGLVDFLLGAPNSFQQGNPALGNPRQQYMGVYARTIFKYKALATAFRTALGAFLPAADKYNRIDHFSAAAFAAGTVSSVYVERASGTLVRRRSGRAADFASRKLSDFEPRVGLAWDPTGKGRQTMRASYSIFYDSPELNYSTHPGQGAPWGSTVTLSSPAGGLTNPFAGYPGGNPFPSPVPPAKNQAFPSSGAYFDIPLNLQPTYTQEWDLSYQRQVGANWLFTATYLGNKTTHTWVQTEENPGVYIPGTCNGKACSTTANLNQRRVLYLQNPMAGAYYSTMALSDGGANSEYNGLLSLGATPIEQQLHDSGQLHLVALHQRGEFCWELAGRAIRIPTTAMPIAPIAPSTCVIFSICRWSPLRRYQMEPASPDASEQLADCAHRFRASGRRLRRSRAWTIR